MIYTIKYILINYFFHIPMNIQKIFLSILGGLFLLYISWFLWLYSTSTVDGVLNLYSNTYGVIPLISGIYGLFVAQRWGGFKSAVGRAISYYLLVNVARGGAVLTDYDTELSPLLNNLKLFFDLAYPIGDIVILALSVLIYGLSFQYLGGRFKLPIILILLG